MEAGYRVIAHVDLDAFYAQVEMVRLGVDRDMPLCVQQWLGIIAVNYPARKQGISRHDTVEDVKKKCPECRLVHVELVGGGEDGKERNRGSSKVSLERYREASAKIFKVITRLVPLVERASIDEAYLDITDMVNKRLKSGVTHLDDLRMDDLTVVGDFLDPSLLSDQALMKAAEIISELRLAIWNELSYTCSAGIAHNKTLAKIASAMNKPNRQTIIPMAAVPDLMETLPMKKIRYLGGKLGAELESLGIESAGDAKKYSLSELEKHVGAKSAQFIHDIVRGIDKSEVVLRSKPKSMLAAKQFNPEHTWESAEKWLTVLSTELHDRLLFDEEVNGREARGLVVSFKTGSNGKMTSKSIAMPREKANRLQRMLDSAMNTLRKTDKFCFPIVFFGLTATNFEDKVDESETISRYFSAGGGTPMSIPERKIRVEPTLPASSSKAIDKFFQKRPTLPSSQPTATPAVTLSCDTVTSDYLLARRLQEEEHKRQAEFNLLNRGQTTNTAKRRKHDKIEAFFSRR